MGQEEYKHVSEKIGKLIETTADTRVEKLKKEYDHIFQERDEKYQQELETKVSQQVELRLNEYEEKAKKAMEQRYQHKLIERDEVHRQKETQYKLHISRIEQENERQKKIIENIPQELRGTAGEIVLFDHLRGAFPKDEIIKKKVGVEMAECSTNYIDRKWRKNSTSYSMG